MIEETTLTLKEAKEQGYTHFCYGHPSNGYQTLHELEELTQQDIDEGTLYLADKETFAPLGIRHEELKETLKNASNSAKTIRTAKDGSWSVTSPMIRTAKALHYVDKQSILSEDNIPKELL